MAMQDLFNLNIFESIDDSNNELRDIDITEGSSEFDCNCPSSAAGGDIDKDATAAKETSIPVPNKTTLSAETYNAALKALQKSFKEASEVIDIISNADIITESRAADKFDMKLYSKGFTILAKVYDKIVNNEKPNDADMNEMDKIADKTAKELNDILDRNNSDECKRFAEKIMGMYKNHPAIAKLRSSAPKSKVKTIDYMTGKFYKDLIAGNVVSIKKYLFNNTAAVQEACDTIDAILDEDDYIMTESVDKNDKKSVKKYLTKMAKAVSKLEIISKQDPSKVEDIDKKISKKYNKAYKKSVKFLDFLAELHEKYKDDEDLKTLIDICEKKVNKLMKKYPNVENVSADDPLFSDLEGDLKGYIKDNPQLAKISAAFESVDAFIDDIINDSDE